jgi:hypothetical protein
MTQPAPAPAQPAAPAPVPAQPPAPVPAPPPAQPPAAPHPAPAPAPQPAQQPAQGRQPSEPGTGDDGLPYYQEGVPWRSLPPDQQLAYWMHRSRKHEDRVASMRDYDDLKSVKAQYDQLVTSTQTEHERAIAEARRQGETTAMARANTMLVEAYIRSAAAARGVDNDAVSDFLETSRLDAFIDGSGQVDTAKVYRQVARMAPSGGVPQAGVPAAPAVPAPPAPPAVAYPQQQPPTGWPPQGAAQTSTQMPGQPAPQWQYGQPQQPVTAVPQWPGQIPAAPQAPQLGQPAAPGAPDFGQGVFNQAPPSGLEAGRAAARARYGDRANKQTANSQAS